MGHARQKKTHISADGTPYSVWQERTRIFCLIIIVWALIEIVFGMGFVTAVELLPIQMPLIMSQFALGPNTVVNGLFNLAVGILGVRSAHNPYKSAMFFWLVLVNALVMVWDFASFMSLGKVSPSSVISLMLVLFLAACAWNVRGQTGYFDNHPIPEDE